MDTNYYTNCNCVPGCDCDCTSASDILDTEWNTFTPCPYARTIWEDDVTPVDAIHMNHIEQGICQNAYGIKQIHKQVKRLIAVDYII